MKEFNVKSKPILSLLSGGGGGSGFISGGATASATYVDDVFNTYVYTSTATSGSDGTELTITTGIDHTKGFLTWIKNRTDASTDNVLFDSERIGTNYKWIYSNSGAAEQDTADIFKNPTSTGFTVKNATSGSGTGRTNPHGSKEMVAWTFRKAAGFFDIVTWTGNSQQGRQIAHDLGSVPGMILVKRLGTSTANWEVWHNSFGVNEYMTLNSTALKQSSGGPWNGTAPTSTHFTVDSTGGDSDVNYNGDTYVAYLFGHNDASFGTDSDEPIIKCGTYTGNGGYQTVDIGFEAQWVMCKRVTGGSGTDWSVFDIMRGAPGGTTTTVGNGSRRIRANSDATEDYSGVGVHSNGFVLGNGSSEVNTSGVTYLYMAIRRPNKPATVATDVFTGANHETGNASPYYKTSGHVSDLVFFARPNTNTAMQILARHMNKEYLEPYSDAQSSQNNYYLWDYMNGMNSYTSSGDDGYNHYSFKRDPGFCDVVTYKGNGSTGHAVKHNLGVAPELLIIKGINYTGDWSVYNSASGNTKYTRFNSANQESSTSFWNSTTPSATTFTLNNNNNVNGSYYYLALLFATKAGISKVGTYTGTGNDINVDCGFTSGARFVLIKRTNANSSDWYVYDTVRGINSGDDPYLLLNHSGQAEVTGTDYIDPLNAGFTITSSAPAALNNSGDTYLFLAVA